MLKNIIRSRKAEGPETSELLELVLVIGVAVILVILLFRLVSPYFDKDKETATSFFNLLKKQITVADSGQVGEFMIYGAKNYNKIYLLYFGDKIRKTYTVDGKDKVTLLNANPSNTLCVCILLSDGKFNCENRCINLNSVAYYSENNLYWDNWLFGKNKKFYIQKINNNYYFSSGLISSVDNNLKIISSDPELITFNGQALTLQKDLDKKECVLSGISAEQMLGFSDLEGDYRLINGILSKKSSIGWDDSVNYLIENSGETNSNNEEVRKLRDSLDIMRGSEAMMLDLNYLPKGTYAESDRVNKRIEMKLGLNGIEVGFYEQDIDEEYNGRFIITSEINGQYKLVKIYNNGQYHDYIYSDNQFVKDVVNSFIKSLSLPENKISYNNKDYDLKFLGKDSQVIEGVFLPSKFVLVLDEKINGFNYGLDYQGVLYKIDGTSWTKLSGKQGVKEDSVLGSGSSAGFIYLEDSEVGKSQVLSDLKIKMTEICK